MEAVRLIPNRRMTPDEVLTHEDLYSEEQLLGESGERRRVREGGIQVGIAVVYSFDLAEFPELVRRRPNLQRRAFLLVEFKFDLDDLSGARRYTKARFEVGLNTPHAIAHSVWPQSVTTTVEVEKARSFAVKADLSLGSVADGPSIDISSERRFRYEELRPIITSFGAGRSSFGWTFTAQDGQPVIPGGRQTYAILELDRDTPTALGEYRTEVDVARRRMGVFELVELRPPCHHPFRIQLTDRSVTLEPLTEG
ncbi:MAG: hypothetical protein JO100_12525 [Pseudonocardia sp.]|nr:hypothetical protein [Pseudonocardia sp.]